MNTDFFHADLRRLFPDTPGITLNHAVNVSARTLCRLGLVWRVDLDPLSWEAGQGEYDLFIPSGTRVVQVLSLGDLQPRTPQQLSREEAGWRERVGRPQFYVAQPTATIRIVPAPMEAKEDAVVPRVALMPTTQTRTLSDDFAWEYERLLFQGAASFLAGNSGWPEFEQACVQARGRATDGNQVGLPRKVRYGGL